jgi:hypothetical protein
VLAPQEAVVGRRRDEQRRRNPRAHQRGEVDVALLGAHRREPLREGHDEQEGEEHLHPWEGHPQLVEQLDGLAVEALLFVFAISPVLPLRAPLSAHLSNILRQRCSLAAPFF